VSAYGDSQEARTALEAALRDGAYRQVLDIGRVGT
jgi:hypothetical protein